MNPTQVVNLGGVIPLSAKAPTAVPMVALSGEYHGTTVVRLVPETLTQAETLTLEHLGMTVSEQHSQVGKSRPQAIGFPAWPIINDPANAQHALNLVADVEWARKMARSQTRKVWDRFDTLTVTLNNSAPHFVPTLLEELARAFDDAGATKFATRAFSKAREVERSYNLTIDNDRHRQMFLEFARRGVISAKELTAEAASCIRRFDDPSKAYAYFLQLNIDRIRAGAAPYAGLPRDLLKIGKLAGKTPCDVGEDLLEEIGTLLGMRHAPTTFLTALSKQLKSIFAQRPELLVNLFSTPKVHNDYWWSEKSELEKWTAAFISAQGTQILKEHPEQFRRWVTLALAELRGKNTYSRSFTDILYAHNDLLAGMQLDETFATLPLEILEALCAAGVHWDFATAPGTTTTQLADYLNRAGHTTSASHRNLKHIAANDELLQHIMYGWTLDDLLKTDYKLLIASKGGALFDALIRAEADNLENAALPAIHKIIHALNIAAKAKISPEVLEYVMSKANLKLENILAANLRYGLFTELTWPELERQVQSFEPTTNMTRHLHPKIEFWDSYPQVVVSQHNHVRVVSGDKTVFSGEVNAPTRLFDMIACTDHATGKTRVLALHGGNVSRIAGMWEDGSTVVVTGPDPKTYWGSWTTHIRSSSLELPTGRLVGNGVISPGQKEVSVIEGEVLGDAQGNRWQVQEDLNSYYAQPTITEVNPESGEGIAHVQPGTLFESATPAGVTVDFRSTIWLPLPEDINEADCVVPVAKGEYRCITGTVDHREHVHITADGTVYRSNTPIDGVLKLPGSLLLMCGNQLCIPTANPALSTLAITRDARGEAHWLYQLPQSAWVNLRVRDAQASSRLRSATPKQAELILAALQREYQPAIPGVDTKERRRKLGSSRMRMYPAVFDNCHPDAPAMKATAQFLGTDDPQLCASVVQLALSVQSLESKLRKIQLTINRELKREAEVAAVREQRVVNVATIRLQQQEQPKPVVHKRTASGKIISASGPQVDQLAKAISGGHSGKNKNWSWVYSVGMEKALVAWASAPLTSAAARVEAIAFLQTLAQVGVDKQTWQQVWVDWSKAGKGVGKSRAGVRFPLSDQDDSPLGVVLGTVRCDNAKGGRHRVLVQGATIPTEVRGSAIFGPTKLAHELGMEPGLTAAEMLDWAKRLEAIEEVDPVAWKAEMQQLIDALTENSILTETAAIMLLAGGMSLTTGDVPVMAATPNMSHWQLQNEEETRMTPIRRALKITNASFSVALELLRKIPRATQELIMVAAFERNIDALKKATAGLPQLGYDLSNAEVEKYLKEFTSGPWFMWENKTNLLIRTTKPLGHNPQLASGEGYGRALGILLDQATSMSLTDPRREFLARQLEALKTAEHDNLRGNKTELPLTGDLSEIPGLRELPWYCQDADAIRALQEGYFDQVIEGLQEPSTDKPSGCVFDPRVVAKETVAAVQQELQLSEDAASYFLQLLTLLQPTDANIKSWNGWKKKQLDAARAELVVHNLVAEGKRARTGRSAFLPGIWWEASAPNIPVEAWKSNFYLIRYLNKATTVVPWCPPTMLYDRLFPQVWNRWLTGDRPSFDQLATKKYRK